MQGWWWTYAHQVMLHSGIAALVVEALLQVWQIHSPLIRYRWRALVLAWPLVAFPLYQWIVADRGGPNFRDDVALFDSSRWRALSLGGGLSIDMAVLAVMLLSGGLLLTQEIVPAWRAWRRAPARSALRRDPDHPDVYLDDVATETIHARGLRHPHIVLSTALRAALDPTELVAVICHERIHLRRHDLRRLAGWFLVRAVQWFNPVALVMFRRMVNDLEQQCDDLVCAETGTPMAYAAALIKVAQRRSGPTTADDQTMRGIAVAVTDVLEHRALVASVRERLARILHPPSDDTRAATWLIIPVGATVATLLFFVV